VLVWGGDNKVHPILSYGGNRDAIVCLVLFFGGAKVNCGGNETLILPTFLRSGRQKRRTGPFDPCHALHQPPDWNLTHKSILYFRGDQML